MGYKYCLRWHEVAGDDDDHEHRCNVPGLPTSRWSMDRHSYIKEFVFGVGRASFSGASEPCIGDGSRIDDRCTKVHLINSEDWDYISDNGV